MEFSCNECTYIFVSIYERFFEFKLKCTIMKSQFSISRAIMLGGMLALITLFSACLKDKNNTPQPEAAGFMAFNLVTDQPGIGVALSGNTVGSLMPYMSYTGGYVRIYPGKRSTDAFAANSNNTLATSTHTYEPDKYYSLFVIGLKDHYENVIVDDGLDTLNAAKGTAYVRYINAIDGKDAMNINISNDTADLYSSQADYGQVSPFIALKAGAVSVAVKEGTKTEKTRTIELEDQKAYTLLLAGNTDSDQPSDTLQIRYIINGTLTLDSTAEGETEKTK